MRTQHILAGAAALAVASGSALAQSSVTMYGIMDVAVEHLTNAAPDGGGLTRVPALTGSLPSRLGFRGIEDLGGGLNANFTLEMGIAPDSGTMNQGGRAFGRQAFVGLSGKWGNLGFGRQYTMLFWSLLDSDVLGPHLHSMANFDPYLPNTRADNSIAYRGTFSGFTVGASYSFGRDVTNAGPSPAGTNCAGESATDSKACREWSAMVKYDSAKWGAAAAVDELRGGPGAFGGLTSSSLTDRRATVNGYVRFGAAKIGAGVIRRDNQGSATPKSDLWYLGVTYPVMPAVTVDSQIVRLDMKNSSNDANLFVVRGIYALSKRTAVYASASHVSNGGTANFSASGAQAGGNPPAGTGQTGFGVGVRHTF